MSKPIELTQGYVTVVDDDDFERVSKHSWCIQQYKDKNRGKKIYAKCSINGTQVTLHRFILNPPKGVAVDHINGDGLDNRKENLRLTSKQGNAANRPKDRVKNATSTYKGVYWNKSTKSWCSRIFVNGKGIYLGLFSYEQDAARAYNEAALNHFGEFAWLNQVA